MSVTLSPAVSIIVRISAIETRGAWTMIESAEIGEIFSRDDSLVVLGPLFEASSNMAKLAAFGFEYFEDYFELPHSGGTVPDWCEVTLTMRGDPRGSRPGLIPAGEPPDPDRD